MRFPTPVRIAASVIAGSLVLASCTATSSETASLAGATSAAGDVAVLDADTPEVWDSSELHAIELAYDESDYEALMSAYTESGEKVWISATATIDGTTFENVGLKLKGNSSLRGASAEDDPETLPWIIRLDKYVDGQSLDGATELVIRSNSSETSLNEALALDLLEAAGLAAEEAVAATVSMNGSEETLRLIVENPNDAWMERELGDGLLWKAESGGTWDYLGEDPSLYTESFDQEGGEDDYQPLIDFLQFVNESDDATFASDLGSWLDVDAFATYLAFQDLVGNTDDIDGPGNNAYLYWDPDAAQMTVVNWDLNLAFGASPGGGGGFGRADAGAGAAPDGTAPDEGVGEWQDGEAPQGWGERGGTPPEGFDPSDLPEDFDPSTLPGGGDLTELPDGAEMPARPGDATAGAQGMPGGEGNPGGGRGGMGGGMGGSNILAERFLAVDEFAALYEAELERLEAELIESGLAAERLAAWSSLLIADASSLVPEATIRSEADALETALDS
ncbi:CotH kinase family protein [Demequina sp. NBRC 110056]|uniref:CotH kinase family protein n=1 Tax=Demequina sp. NBRC 110056 TaxID=1570345 RepID=UPI000A075B0C|nr:CotH kinase family protein [Demequina sp. NBRC 110056]